MSSLAPLIGITADYQITDSYSAYPWYALRENYVTAISQFGAIPLILPYNTEIANHPCYPMFLDGLIITGGHFDIDPAYYGSNITSNTVISNNKRTAFEYKLCQTMLAAHKPILGICGGEQLINVVLGGTLIQHVPDIVPNCLEHEQKNPKHLPSHNITIKPNSLLNRIAKVPEYKVNSSHHQAVATLGVGLIASAWSADKVIEAIEHTTHPFCLGVQWHPEFGVSNEDQQIFQAFIGHCLNGRKQ